MILLKGEFKERPIVVSVSGGKDSVATCLALRDAGIDHVRVFADTGWEHKSTYEHLDYLREVLGPIDVVRGPLDFVELCRSKQILPSRIMRFCTERLKVLPIVSYQVGFGDDVISAVGIRAGESHARARLPQVDENHSTGVTVWRPIIRWTEYDVVDIHRRHGVRLHPLYRLGANRVGCWPCIFASKADIRLMADIDPERIAMIRELEIELSSGKEKLRSFFWLKRNGRNRPVTIDEAVDWSRQVLGTYLLELDDPGKDWPCARWGFCEVPS